MRFKRMNNRDNQIIVNSTGTPSFHSVYNIYPQKDNSLKGLIHDGAKKVRVTMPDLYSSFWSVVL